MRQNAAILCLINYRPLLKARDSAVTTLVLTQSVCVFLAIGLARTRRTLQAWVMLAAGSRPCSLERCKMSRKTASRFVVRARLESARVRRTDPSRARRLAPNSSGRRVAPVASGRAGKFHSGWPWNFIVALNEWGLQTCFPCFLGSSGVRRDA